MICLCSCLPCWGARYAEAPVNSVSTLGWASAPLRVSLTFSWSAHLPCPSGTGMLQINTILFKFPTPFYFAHYFIKYLRWPGVSYVNYKPLRSPLPAPRTTTEFTFRPILLGLLQECLLSSIPPFLPRTSSFVHCLHLYSPWVSNYSECFTYHLYADDSQIPISSHPPSRSIRHIRRPDGHFKNQYITLAQCQFFLLHFLDS